jgi:hypothetical protein
LCAANTSRRRPWSARLPRSSGPHFTAQSCPCVKSSKTMGAWPDAARSFAVWLPM